MAYMLIRDVGDRKLDQEFSLLRYLMETFFRSFSKGSKKAKQVSLDQSRIDKLKSRYKTKEQADIDLIEEMLGIRK